MRSLAIIGTLLLLASVLNAKQPRTALNVGEWVGQTVMFVAAHPDDIDAMAGGLISQLTQQGTNVWYVIFTNGDKGGLCVNGTEKYACSSEELAVLRKKEQKNAAVVLGVDPNNIWFMDLEDGDLTSYAERDLRRTLTIAVRTVKPDVVIAWFPFQNMEAPPMLYNCPSCWMDLGYHPDHQASGRIAFDTVVGPSSGDALMFKELQMAGLEAWKPLQFWMFALANDGTHYFSLSDAQLQLKLKAFLQHESQYINSTQVTPILTWIASTIGESDGVKYAENFRPFF